MPVAMATIGKTLFAHFRQVLHASAQYDQARTVFRRLKKRLEICSLSWDQTVTFSDLAHGLEIRSFVLLLRTLSRHLTVRITKNAKCFEECNVFGNGKCELSANQEGRN